MYKDPDKARLYSIWYGMKKRCSNPKTNCYHRYGGRGITVCKEWDVFNSFYEWAIHNGYKDGLTLDRINNNGNYQPSNCKWVTWKVQQNKRSTNRFIKYNGKTQTLIQWAEEVGINASTIGDRLDLGWSIEDALTIFPKENTLMISPNEYHPNNTIQKYFKKFLIIQNNRYHSFMEISNITGVSRKCLSEWKNGKRMPKYHNIKKIMSLFDISTKDFLGDYSYVYNSKIFNNTDFVLFYIDTNKQFTLNDFNKYLNVKKPYKYIQNLISEGYDIQIIDKDKRINIYQLISGI